MKKDSSRRSPGFKIGVAVALVALVGLVWGIAYYLRTWQRHVTPTSSRFQGSLPNNQLMQNPGGEATTVSPKGSVNLTGEFFKARGKNGQGCVTCHIPEEAWSITPATLQRLFDETDGRHPVFTPLDINNPNMDVSSKESRRAAYRMLLTRGLFRRGGAPPVDAEFEIIAVDDPSGLATPNLIVEWRRSMPTINFAWGSSIVNWDSANSRGRDQRAGLVHQAERLINAMQGSPSTPEAVNEVVDFETSLITAQLTVPGVGRLDADGARGGAEALSTMKKEEGGFDIYDAWKNSDNPGRAQIARGQAVFNSMNVTHKSCTACHNSLNNGTNIDNDLFNINSAAVEMRFQGLPLYTFRNKQTGETIQLTDAGLGNITGLWADLGRFKTPSLRGLAARAPYFHNGSALTLEEVVIHYEKHFGFVFTDEERADLVAFLNAL
jgi:cytochrome c peroxidase